MARPRPRPHRVEGHPQSMSRGRHIRLRKVDRSVHCRYLQLWTSASMASPSPSPARRAASPLRMIVTRSRASDAVSPGGVEQRIRGVALGLARAVSLCADSASCRDCSQRCTKHAAIQYLGIRVEGTRSATAVTRHSASTPAAQRLQGLAWDGYCRCQHVRRQGPPIAGCHHDGRFRAHSAPT